MLSSISLISFTNLIEYSLLPDLYKLLSTIAVVFIHPAPIKIFSYLINYLNRLTEPLC